MAMPPRAATESTDRTLHNHFEKFWWPMDMKDCSQLLAGIRSVDDPLMANGLTQQKSEFELSCRV
jgi:hypothetical protein